jgi:hypothetical protein
MAKEIFFKSSFTSSSFLRSPFHVSVHLSFMLNSEQAAEECDAKKLIVVIQPGT